MSETVDSTTSDNGGSVLTSDATTAQTTVDTTVEATTTTEFPANWKDMLPEDLKASTALEPIQDIPNLVKSFINAQKMIGSSNKFTKPDQFATDEERVNFFRQVMDVPSKLEEYNVDVPKEANFNDGFITALKELAFNQGMAPNQTNALLKWYADFNNQALAEHEQQVQSRVAEQTEALKKEWGEAFNKRLALAKATAKEFGDEDVFSWLDDSGLGNDTKLIKMLAKIGEVLKEDNVITENLDADAKAPSELQSQINEILSNFSHPYHQQTHPNHQAAVKEVQNMFSRLYPNQG